MKRLLILLCMLTQLAGIVCAMEPEEPGKRKLEEEPTQSSKKQKTEAEKQTVQLVSSTGKKFAISIKVANKSEILKNLIQDLGGGEIPLPNISHPVLVFVASLMSMRPFSLEEIKKIFPGMYSEYVKGPHDLLSLYNYILPSKKDEYGRKSIGLIVNILKNKYPETADLIIQSLKTNEKAFISDLANAVNFLDFKESFPLVGFMLSTTLSVNDKGRDAIRDLIAPLAADFAQAVINQIWLHYLAIDRTVRQRLSARNMLISVAGNKWGFSIKELLQTGIDLRPQVGPGILILDLLCYGINNLDGLSSIEQIEEIANFVLDYNQLFSIKANDFNRLKKVQKFTMYGNFLSEIEGSLLAIFPSNCIFVFDQNVDHLINQQGYNCMSYRPNSTQHVNHILANVQNGFKQAASLVPPLPGKNFIFCFIKSTGDITEL